MSARRASVLAVTETIRDRILSGDYPPGHHLRETAVAADLNVSRTPVREALHRLAADGLVELYPNRGARVAGWSDEEVEEIFGLRVLLEGYAASRAAAQMDDETLAELTELAARMEEIDEADGDGARDEIAELNVAFHLLILDRAGNPQLTAFASSLARLLVHDAFQRFSEMAVRRSFSHHAELIGAFRARDGEWAGAVMRAHLLAGRRELQ